MNKVVKFEKFSVGKKEYNSPSEWYESEFANNGKRYLLVMTDTTYNMEWKVEIGTKNLSLERMEYTVENAEVLEEAINLIKMAKKEYEEGKETNRYFYTKNGEYVSNAETGNLNAINVFNFGYVVYGNLVTNGQVDSRYNTDEELVREVLKYLSKGFTITEERPGMFVEEYRIPSEIYSLGGY